MADFVAVIRKAVDGLANNTPEMRARVYEKARGAVQRQLENMKPRPPEELLRRQMNKIDAAIAEVESEHAEAIESVEEEAIYAGTSPQPEEPEYEDAHEDAAARQAPDEAAGVDTPYHPPVEPGYAAAHEPEPEYEAGDEHIDDPHAVAGPVEAYEPVSETDHHTGGVPDNLYEQPERPQFIDDGSPAAEDEWRHGVDDAAEPVRAAASWSGDIDDGAARDVAAHEDAATPNRGYEVEADGNWRDLPNEPDDIPAPVSHDEAYRPQFEEPVLVPEDAYEPLPGQGTDAPAITDHAVQPAGTFYDEPAVEDRADSAPAAGSVTAEAVEPGHFEEVAWDDTLEPVSEKDKASEKPDQTERSPWEDLEELIGYDGGKESGRVAGDDKAASAGVIDDVAPVSYAHAKKKKRNYTMPVLVLLGVALLAGGGYAVWLNRDAMNDMVGGLIQAAGSGDTTPATTPAGPSETDGQAPVTTQAPTPGGTGNNVPGDDGVIEGTKFTQRLLANGGEVDEGEAGAPAGQTVNGEGQSVARQNEAPPPEGAPQDGTATAAPPAGTAPPAQTQAPAAAGAALPAGAERVFLYEERLGQTVPTTLEGSVAWTLLEEPGENGAPDKVVQGRIEVPGRGLSALITFRRNTDSSLPASHLVEIVFSVGAGFDGGAIESVQRIAMKQTEQDRGNALVAVPARITDDFHMIALNDFPDARAGNLELLRTRNWIDIPVTYRNGRRALLTMPKGPEGVKAFDEALTAWAAQPASSQ